MKLDLSLSVSSQLLEDFGMAGLVENEAGADYMHFADGCKVRCSRSTAGRTPGCIDCKPVVRTEDKHPRIAVVDCSAGRIAGRDHIPHIVGIAGQVERTERRAERYWRWE